jgi:hypothetical protein
VSLCGCNCVVLLILRPLPPPIPICHLSTHPLSPPIPEAEHTTCRLHADSMHPHPKAKSVGRGGGGGRGRGPGRRPGGCLPGEGTGLADSHTSPPPWLLGHSLIYNLHLSTPRICLDTDIVDSYILALLSTAVLFCCSSCISSVNSISYCLFINLILYTPCLAKATHTRRAPLPRGNRQTTAPAAPSAPPQTRTRTGHKYQISPNADASRTELPSATTVSLTLLPLSVYHHA